MAALLADLGTAPEDLDDRLEAIGSDDVLVADLGGRAVGMAVLHVMPLLERPTATAVLTALVVAADARGKGVGAALVAEAERRARAAGCWRLLVLSGRDRTDAHAFYRRLGFEERTRAFVRRLGGD